MSHLKKLLSSDIRYECGDSSYERGKRYYEKNQVLDLAIKSEGELFVQLTSIVQGSESYPYNQTIRITWKADYNSAEIDGNCSCPVGYNCKHIVAACLKYQNPSLKILTQPSQVPLCLDWLNSLDEPATEMPDPEKEFIAYILTPSPVQNEFSFDFVITKEKKTGGFTKGRKTTLENLRYSFAYHFSYNHAKYIRSQDQGIIKLLYSLDTSAGKPLLTGAAGHLVLMKLLQTGRLFWQDLERQPLKPGPPRNLRFDWQQSGGTDYHLTVTTDPNGTVLLTDPPQYLDSALGLIGTINDSGLGVKRLKKVLSIPPVPIKVADEFSMRLTVEHPDLPLPAPKQVELTELDNLTPIPRLVLSGGHYEHRYLHFIAVRFDYDGFTLTAKNPDRHSVIKSDRGLFKIKRDNDEECKSIQRLSAMGFIALADIKPDEQDLLLYYPSQKLAGDSATHWDEFLQNTVPVLEQEGWVIETADSFKLNFQTSQTWNAEISETGNDWFEMRFNVEINGQYYPLLPMIMPVLEDYDPENLPETVHIPISEHNYLTVPGEKIKPFLDVLFELFNGSNLAADGSLKLSRFNAASLADLEEHNYGLFSLSGGAKLREMAQKLKTFSGIADVALPLNLKAELRHYQQQGLNWLQFLREYHFAGILADDMGLGKTIQTLAHLLLEKQSGRMTAPCLIIAPTSLMSNWRREAERFTPDLNVLILQGAERKQRFDQIKDYDLILTTYPLLPRDEETLLEQDYYYLILDEAQVVKNPLAKAAQIVRRIKCSYRLCLTGTPMENHLGELWTQFDFLLPGFLGDSATFKKQYRTPIENHGSQQQKARLTQRIAPFMLRRTKQDVITELPPKTEIIRSVPLYPKQAALYESIRLAMEKKVRDAIAEKGLSRSHITILDALLKLRQTCCDPRTLKLKEAQKIKESAKLDLLMDILPEQLEEGRRILLFSQFTRMIALIEERLDAQKITYSKLTGQTRNREAAIDQFKNGETSVFLISLKAGGVGLNLTEADTVIIYDPWWNPAVETQAADRAHRIGQDKPVFVYKLITENTVEEKILAMQERKRLLAESIYQDGGKETSLKFTADDLTALFEPLASNSPH